ncbi:PEP-CTERM sorting domain-containing protein [Alteromonas oceanisediminis]|uniref:PEP-CTERM sorting domain-containing protein n=1 Tax=Alteromonas oceanisediminis TaxID=2836180 RepID=UPI001BDAA3F3|nr:PEP-CTERM sorting domain-containing protein [Alteromonas oceanisediminis]MBT0586306.1 PEP-CTERM sorting domain-containing protein [Alteromonas oceanisediminis]
MKGLSVLVLAATMLLQLTHTAHAAVITVNYDGFSQGKGRISQSLDGVQRNSLAGMYDLTVKSNDHSFFEHDPNNPSGIDAFCVELDQFLTTKGDVDYNLMTGLDFFHDSHKVDQIGRLYTGFFHTLAQQTTQREQRTYSAAFQVALWDLVYDSSSPDLAEGRYQATSSSPSGVISLASNWLSKLGSITSNFNVFVLQSDTSQDLLLVNPATNPTPNASVPEPATAALFAIALGFAIHLRRKQAKAGVVTFLGK